VTSRFVVGIDLGTTNCALAWADTSADPGTPIHMQEIPQLLNPGEPGHRGLLPSFLYIPGDIDFPAGSLALPWDPSPSQVIGDVARRRGAENPSRLVASAKSWLSHGGASRKAPILPWGAPSEIPHISPVEASAAYLRHLAAAFDQDVAGGKRTLALSRQDVLLTVPASFDEEARELTVQAAAAAGLTQVTLLEEPQAAFYAWIDGLGDAWRRRVAVGDLILVCDVGGGTTDFSQSPSRMLAISPSGASRRGHILLGGDNMDLALARLAQQRLEAAGHKVDTRQLHGPGTRAALKESLSRSVAARTPVTSRPGPAPAADPSRPR
jgi:molecular chaperone DnaK (HSP70)